MFEGELNICKDCHQLITDEKFINKVYYLSDNSRLVSVSGDTAKIEACMNCLNAFLEKNKKKLIDKVEFQNRDIYILKKSFLEKAGALIISPASFWKKLTTRLGILGGQQICEPLHQESMILDEGPKTTEEQYAEQNNN